MNFYFYDVGRFLAIEDFIDPSDVELASLFPSHQEIITFQNLFENLKDVSSRRVSRADRGAWRPDVLRLTIGSWLEPRTE